MENGAKCAKRKWNEHEMIVFLASKVMPGLMVVSEHSFNGIL